MEIASTIAFAIIFFVVLSMCEGGFHSRICYALRQSKPHFLSTFLYVYIMSYTIPGKYLNPFGNYDKDFNKELNTALKYIIDNNIEVSIDFEWRKFIIPNDPKINILKKFRFRPIDNDLRVFDDDSGDLIPVTLDIRNLLLLRNIEGFYH